MKTRTVAIVPAAGYGKRLGLKVKKPFVSLGGKPLITYALTALNKCRQVDAIIVAIERSCIGKFRGIAKRYKFTKLIHIVAGGSTRLESVRNCLNKVGPSFEIILIHDGARPFVEEAVVNKSIQLARRYGGCIVALPESDTVKLVDKRLFVKKTLRRDQIFRAQTPQVFKRQLLEKAYRRKLSRDITDDSSLVEALGGKVKVLKGSYRNIKVTTREDLKRLEVFL